MDPQELCTLPVDSWKVPGWPEVSKLEVGGMEGWRELSRTWRCSGWGEAMVGLFRSCHHHHHSHTGIEALAWCSGLPTSGIFGGGEV